MRIFPVTLMLFLLFGCTFFGPGPTNTTNATNNTNATPEPKNYTCPDGTTVQDPDKCPLDYLCPFSCNDYDHCTEDICNQQTGYECAHNIITPCCGNNICELEESTESCMQDCGECPPSCNDDNPCTIDDCNSTSFECIYENLYGNVLKCSGYPGFQGYSNVHHRFGISPPIGWFLNESWKEDSIAFLGPKSRQNCSETDFIEKGYYSDITYWFSVDISENWFKRDTDWDGVVFAKNGSKTTVYITSSNTTNNLEKRINWIRSRLLEAKKQKKPIDIFGTSMENITVSEDKTVFADLNAFEFTITGHSNRTGNLSFEIQKQIYFVSASKFYQIALVGESNQDISSEKILSTFSPIALFECKKNLYSVNIVLSSEPSNPTYYDLDKYVNDDLSELEKETDFLLIARSDTKFIDEGAKAYVVQLFYEGFRIKRKVVLTTIGDRLYKAELNTLSDEYLGYLPTFDSVLNSFTALGTPDSCKHRTCVDGKCAIIPLDDCCGNDACEATENCSTCFQDCGTCTSKFPLLDAKLSKRPGEPENYTTYNCEWYLVRISINNPLDEVMSVYSDDVLKLRKSVEESECRISPNSVEECIATMSGSFGEPYKSGTIQKKITLYSYGGIEKEDGETIYSTTLTYPVHYDIYWIGPHCMHFYCIPGETKVFQKDKYTITGIEPYRGDLQFGNWWCRAETLKQDYRNSYTLVIYFNDFYDRVCQLRYVGSQKKYEKCYNE